MAHTAAQHVLKKEMQADRRSLQIETELTPDGGWHMLGCSFRLETQRGVRACHCRGTTSDSFSDYSLHVDVLTIASLCNTQNVDAVVEATQRLLGDSRKGMLASGGFTQRNASTLILLSFDVASYSWHNSFQACWK